MLRPVLVVHRCVDEFVEENFPLSLEGELLEKIDPIRVRIPTPIGRGFPKLRVHDLPHLGRGHLVDVNNRNPKVDLLGEPSSH